MLVTAIVRTLSGSLVAAALLATGAIGATVVQSHASDPAARVVIATPAAALQPTPWIAQAPTAMPVASHQPNPTAVAAATAAPTPRPKPHATKAPLHHIVRHATATRRPTAARTHHGSGSHDGHSGDRHGDCWD